MKNEKNYRQNLNDFTSIMILFLKLMILYNLGNKIGNSETIVKREPLEVEPKIQYALENLNVSSNIHDYSTILQNLEPVPDLPFMGDLFSTTEEDENLKTYANLQPPLDSYMLPI